MTHRKKFRSFEVLATIIIVCVLSTIPKVYSQSSIGTLRCIPLFDSEILKTECRIESASTDRFTVSEITLPFKVTRLDRISSPLSPLVGTLYPPDVIGNTIVITALNLGNNVERPGFDRISFNGISFLMEMSESLTDMKNNSPESIPLYYLDEGSFRSGTLEVEFDYNTSLFREVFTRNSASIGAFEFIKLGTACFDKTAQVCVTNLIEGLTP